MRGRPAPCEVDPIGEMERLYKLISARCKEDPATLENARQELVRVDHTWGNTLISGRFLHDSIPTEEPGGLFTNVFTLEPRRYGAAVGFKF